MALTDEQMQDLQSVTKKSAHTKKEGDEIKVDGKKYEVVNSVDGTTQVIAVAPVDKNGNVDYSQTAIVVAGTQPGANESTDNALKARDGMTPQYKDVRKFYHETEKKVNTHDGDISNMSGFSQSGPAVAKVATDNKVGKVTNFMDWGAQAAYNNGDITKEEKKYLDKHAVVYTDTTKDVTWLDGHGGAIPYGKKVHIEGSMNLVSDHDPNYPHIKGNDPDVNWYVKHHQFTSGMTKEQVKEVAKYKAEHDWNPLNSAQDYIDDYQKEYGDYAKKKTSKIENSLKSRTKVKAKPTATTSLGLKHKFGNKLDFKDLLRHYKGAKGSKRILLRKALLFAGLSAAIKDVGDLAEKVQQLMDQSKEDIKETVEETRAKAFDFAQELDAAEVESLLAEIDFNRIWSEGVEAENLVQAKNFAVKVEKLGSKVLLVGDAIEEADQGAAEKVVVFNEEVIKDFN